jgi:hypothetical protein
MPCFGNALHHMHVAHVQLVSARRPFVGADFAGHNDAGFISQILERLKHFGSHLVLGHHSLDYSRAVAEDGKEQFAALALVVEPAADGDRLAVMPANFGDGGDGRGRGRSH